MGVEDYDGPANSQWRWLEFDPQNLYSKKD